MSEDLPITPPEEGNEDLEKPSRRMAELPDGTLVVVEGKSFIENKFEYYLVDYGNDIKDKVRAYNIVFRDDLDISEGEPKPAYSNEEVTELTPEQQQARKEIINFLTPRIKAIQDRKDNPPPGDEFQLAKLETLVKLAHDGEFTKMGKYSGTNVQGKNQEGANSILKYFASALEFEKEGSKRQKQILNIINSLENAGIDISLVTQKAKAQHNKEPEPKKDVTNKHDIQDPKDKGNGNGNNNDSPETANGSDENEWLDPRFILFLKEKYKQMLEDESINTARVRDKLTDHYKKDIIRTRVIELAIRNRIGRDQWLAGARYGENRLAGFEPSNNHEIQRPSEEILQEIASKMDLSNEELMLEASDKNKKLNEHTRKFKPGEKVRIFLRGGKGEVDYDWIVKGYQNDYAPGVLVTKGKVMHKFSEKQLREFQDRPQPSEIENNIERLKPFFGKTVKILEDGQVVEAKFAGVRIDGKFYIDQETGEFVTDSNGNVWTDEQNNPIPKHTRQEFDFDKIDEFLSWQSLKTEAEIAAEQIAKQAAKVERINREMPEDERKFELGQEVKIMRGKTVDTGWTVDDFKKAGNKVEVVLIKEGKRFSAEQEMLANWQLSPEGFVPSIEPKDDDKSSDKQDASQDNKDEKQKSDPNNRYKDKENHIKKLEERLVKLKEEEIRKSMWEKRTAQWKNFWKQFDAGETSREVRLNKRRKKIARIAGGVAVVGLWPVTIYGGVVGSGALFSNQKYHNTIRRIHNREISTLERDIREEKEELERIKKKDAETK
jgi:hypothetical protein